MKSSIGRCRWCDLMRGVIDTLVKKPVLLVLAMLLASVMANVVAMLSYPPWIDEAIIADIAYGYFKGDAYQHQNFLLAGAAEGRIYGPVFFYLQSFFLYAFGDNPFSFRLPNAVAGYMLIAVVGLLCYLHTRNRKFTLWLTAALLISARLSSNAVSGRMDLVATFFALASLLCAYHYYKTGLLRTLLGCALLCSLAYLTTPRAVFLLPASLVMLLYSIVDQHANNIATKQITRHFAYAGAAFIVPLCLWILAVGGLKEYVGLFLKPEMSGFWGPAIIRDWRDWIYLPVLFFLIVTNWRAVRADKLAVACCVTWVIFSLCVEEVGPYKAMRLPYTFLLGALTVNLIANSRRQALAAGVVASLVTAISVASFMVRSADTLYINRDCRNAEEFERQVLASTPARASFLADYSFFYLLKGRPATFGRLGIEALDFKTSGYPDRILVQGEAIKNLKQDSPLYAVINDEYEVVASYSCPVRSPILRETFENRRNFNDVRLYGRKPGASIASRINNGTGQ